MTLSDSLFYLATTCEAGEIQFELTYDNGHRIDWNGNKQQDPAGWRVMVDLRGGNVLYPRLEDAVEAGLRMLQLAEAR